MLLWGKKTTHTHLSLYSSHSSLSCLFLFTFFTLASKSCKQVSLFPFPLSPKPAHLLSLDLPIPQQPNLQLVLVNQPDTFASISSNMNTNVMFVSVVGLMAATLDCLTLLRLSPRDIHHYRETFSDGQTDFLNNPFNDCFVGLCCDTHLCFSHALPGVLLWRESIWQLTISIDFLGFIIREVTDDRR